MQNKQYNICTQFVENLHVSDTFFIHSSIIEHVDQSNSINAFFSTFPRVKLTKLNIRANTGNFFPGFFHNDETYLSK